MEKAQEAFEAAIQAEEAGDSDRAIRLYEQTSLLAPQHPLPLLRLAILLSELGEWKQAIRVGRQVTKRWPRAHPAYCVIARSYAELGRWTMAERFFRKAATIRKGPETLLFLGVALSSLERNDEAQECFHEALKLDPDNKEIHLNLGRIHKVKGQLVLAEKHFKRAIELNQKYALGYADLGELLAGQKNRTTEAVGYLKCAVDHNPEDRWSRAYLANALWKLRKLKAAEEQLRRLIELWPNGSLPYWCYGDFLACERNDSSTADEALWLDWPERDRLINLILQLKKQYPGTINMLDSTLELMKSHNAKRVTDSCRFRLKAFALGPTGEDKGKCMMGNNADCDRCGCIVPFHMATTASRRLILKETVKRLAS